MAKIFPQDFETADEDSRFRYEIATLKRLEKGLPDEYRVYHSVHWSNTKESTAIYGEIDFLIVAPNGKILAIEQKDAQLSLNEVGELAPIYFDPIANKSKFGKAIKTQMIRNIGNITRLFSKRYQGKKLDIEHLLYTPNATINEPYPANIAKGRVVDVRNNKDLIRVIESIFHNSHLQENHHGVEIASVDEIEDFLSETASITPQLGLIGNEAKLLTTKLSGGLAQWAERLDFSPFRLWVQGTAGSGKTQLALKELKRAKSKGKLAMYFCFNRPLADAMKLVAPEPNNCMNFHDFANLVAINKGRTFIFNKNDVKTAVYAEMVNFLVANMDEYKGELDVLVIDEGQDFEPIWAEALLSMVKKDGRALWLEDPLQNVYKKNHTNIENWVKITSPVNYRSPHQIVNMINALELTAEPVESGSGIVGMEPVIYTYTDESLVDQTALAVQDLIDEQFSPKAIALLSFKGKEKSRLLADDIAGLGRLTFKKYLGYDEVNKRASWQDGDLLIDTIYRFKGQCADAVVLTEIDFDTWTDREKSLLFVGLSRARLKVALVMTDRVKILIDEKVMY